MFIKNVVFIDSRVAGYETLIAGFAADTRWYLLDADQDGIEQIQRSLATSSGLDSVQVISHGSAGTLYLGNTVLDSANLVTYTPQLQAIGASLGETGDLLLYGCNVAQGNVGSQFVQSMSDLAGADVAASNDFTGAASQHADSVLEFTSGSVETRAYDLSSLKAPLALMNGTSGSDYLDGTATNDTLLGGAGNDWLNGKAGNDSVDGGAGNDYITTNAGEGNDTLLGGAGNDTINAWVQDFSGAQSVRIYGGDGDDSIRTYVSSSAGGDDSVIATGGAGRDTYGFFAGTSANRLTVTDFTVGANGDLIDVNELLNYSASNGLGYKGGNPLSTTNGYLRLVQSGKDTLLQYDEDGAAGSRYTWHTAMTLQNVQASTVTTSQFKGLTLQGTEGADTLTGSFGVDMLSGIAGNDVLNGAEGADTLAGGAGNDTYHVDTSGDVIIERPSEGTDIVLSTASNFTLSTNVENGRIVTSSAANLSGNALNNGLFAGTGNNVLAGGDGIDTLSYLYGTTGNTGVNVSLALTAAQNTGGSGTDTLSGFENLSGSNFADTLTGSTGNNILSGGNGNDRLSGADGNDTLIGGAGQDTLSGGSGNDVFDFNALAETGITRLTWDVITDFVRGQDKIDLLTLDANAATAANDAFTSLIVGTGFSDSFTAPATLYFDSSARVLYGYTDADAGAEFAVQLTGINTLSTADLVL